jgi:hypothetical protein
VIELKVQINIDELVLEGFEQKDCLQVTSAAKLELARLIMQKELFPNISSYDNKSYSTKNETPILIHLGGKNPSTAGIQIARFVFQAL